ncbi:hypothetical protein [Pseudanabaena sp. PCC 6802]|uniref:hypothetical protein n=1 Tax=Pseudanabaena sp. PCC 6802 TaxID=118173 RepID=UPI00034CA702|nr:hypothetical protein [Pseudanabaena sp. PCC 6802]
MLAEDISDARAFVEVALEQLGLTWRGERVQAWLAAVSRREGRSIQSTHYIPCRYWRMLARSLAVEIGAEWLCENFRDDSADSDSAPSVAD